VTNRCAYQAEESNQEACSWSEEMAMYGLFTDMDDDEFTEFCEPCPGELDAKTERRLPAQEYAQLYAQLDDFEPAPEEQTSKMYDDCGCDEFVLTRPVDFLRDGKGVYGIGGVDFRGDEQSDTPS
jgi:hypothetical protein